VGGKKEGREKRGSGTRYPSKACSQRLTSSNWAYILIVHSIINPSID
jgi:hypothetical protein